MLLMTNQIICDCLEIIIKCCKQVCQFVCENIPDYFDYPCNNISPLLIAIWLLLILVGIIVLFSQMS